MNSFFLLLRKNLQAARVIQGSKNCLLSQFSNQRVIYKHITLLFQNSPKKDHQPIKESINK